MTKNGPQETRFFQVAVCAVGIFVCYIIYGGLQERMCAYFKFSPSDLATQLTQLRVGTRTTIPYTLKDGTSVKFNADNVLVFIQCIAHSIYSFIGSYLSKNNVDTTPKKNYAIVALTYLGGMLSSYAALDFISFPTTVVVKSCKMIPVMLMGSFFGKRYSADQYLKMALVAVGVAMVMLKEMPDLMLLIDSVSESVGAGTSQLSSDHVLGILLTLTSLTFDGLTGALQDSFVQVYKPSVNQLMFGINIFSSLYLGLLLSTFARSEIWFSWNFIVSNPSILIHIGAFCLVSCIGQTFIFYAVTTLGSLICSLVTTTRKLFTVLLSVIFVGHALTRTQSFGVAIVFIGLLWDSLSPKSPKSQTSASATAAAASKKSS